MEETVGNTVHIGTIIHSPVERVWEAWIEPNMVLQWFGPGPNGKGVSASVDAKPGGSFEITFANADGTEFTCFGTYKEVEPYCKLAFTCEWRNEPGVMSFVTVALSPVDGGSLMQFRHANVGTASAHDYQQGWASKFNKLKRLIGNKPL